MNLDKIDNYIKVYKDGLLKDTLNFWLPACLDHEFGGYTIALDRKGDVFDSDKGMWQQARFAWFLSHIYNKIESKDEWLQFSKHGIDFIDQYGFDSLDGRMWFHVTQDGQPIRKRRYHFTETFTCIAYAEYSKASQDETYKEKAIHLFRKYQSYLNNNEGTPKFTNTRPLVGMGRPMIDIVTCQVLRETIQLPEANKIIDQCIDQIHQLFLKPELKCVMETVGPQGEIYDTFDGRLLNPGHAIEGAWFIMNEGRIRNKKELIDMGCQMLDWMWDRGWDEKYGGILYFTDVYNKPIQEYWHDMKFWWPHNETIIATLLAYELTGNPKYEKMHKKVHNWSYQHFPDKKLGEWFGYLHRDGSISSDLKGNLWKGPFHMPRMQLNCWQILERMKSNQSS